MKDPTLIKGEDLLINGAYRQVTMTISKASIERRKNESGEKEGILLYFEKATKPLFCPLDQLNHRMLKAELGTTDPAQMIGKSITIIPVKGDWFGETNTLAVRVLVTGSKPKPRVGKKAFGEPVTGLKIGQEVAEKEQQ
jgi:hypothetical protein